jgi:pimeloyl-ACP methyl ester carboxylesterase
VSGTLVFSHANSYPAACYRLLFEAWKAAGWEVHALPKFGHDSARPVTSNWPHLLQELLHFIDHEVRPTAPVALVGHSLGGLLSLMAAAKRPELARCVVQLDSPYISGWRQGLVIAGKATGLAFRVPPASIARGRRKHWPSPDAVRQHFGSKRLFQAWDPRVLEDYLQHGFEPDPVKGGVQLAFKREVEMRIYAGLPHNLPSYAKRVRVPIGFVAGKRSVELRQGGLAATRRFIKPENYLEIDGSHLFPFEHPEASAALVLSLLQRLG